MSDDQANMWTYWRDKYGYQQALQEYYPNLLKQQMVLTVALVQIQSSEAMIDRVMAELAEKEE